MKKLASRVLSMLLVIACISCIITVHASALTAEEIIIFRKTYTKNEKFMMPVDIGAGGTVSANLTDSNNNVIETFTTLLVQAGTTITYKRSFSGVKPGLYYLNVNYIYAAYYGLGEKSFSRRLEIKHNGPPPKLIFSQTYQTYTDSGDVSQVFKFDYFNASGKIIKYEIYDEYGNFIAKNGLTTKHMKGSCTFQWNYYPSQGGLMVSSGTYIIKYWIQGQTPKQINFLVELAEG
ncbi:hypothetical protein V6615_14010 [Oscillospiraceae bacterium PP1C4]